MYWSLQSGYLSVWLIATSSVSSNSLGEIELLVIVVTLLALIFFSQSLSALPHIRALLSLDGGMSGLTALKQMFNKNWWIQPNKLPFHYSWLGVKLLSFDGDMFFAEVFCAWDARVCQVWKVMEGREIEGGGLWREFRNKINFIHNGRSGNTSKEKRQQPWRSGSLLSP